FLSLPLTTRMHFELDHSGLIPSEEDQPHHPPQPIYDHPINKHLFRPDMVLKSLSRSDPHLNFTGHLHHEDDGPLTQAVYGLLEASSAHPDHIHHMTSSRPTNPIISSLKGPTLTNSASSAALLDPSVQNQGAPLRKSSSAVDWSLLADVGKEKDAFHQLAERPGAFLGGKKATSHYGFSALSLLGTHKDEGLVMNTPSSSSHTDSHMTPHSRNSMFSGLTGGHSASPLVAAASACLHGTSSSSKMGSVVPSTSGASTSNPLQPSASTPALQMKNPLDAANQSAAAQHEQKHGMLGSVFNRGFLGRPIQRSDEENYRYIMALDR
ncbi:hypothetical protein PENTCL1PPCAC_28453, partial [Pristionchus entomophagus]